MKKKHSHPWPVFVCEIHLPKTIFESVEVDEGVGGRVYSHYTVTFGFLIRQKLPRDQWGRIKEVWLYQLTINFMFYLEFSHQWH